MLIGPCLPEHGVLSPTPPHPPKKPWPGPGPRVAITMSQAPPACFPKQQSQNQAEEEGSAFSVRLQASLTSLISLHACRR